MNTEKISAFVESNRMRDPLGSGIFLHLVQRGHPHGEGGTLGAYCSAITFTRWPKDGRAYEPADLTAVNLSEADAQALMESLWNAGVRPSQAAGSIGQLAAVERHLADMREIARFKLGMNK